MKAIKITEERQNEILPQNIKETDVLSDDAKKTLATIMNYFVVLNIARTSGYLICSNTVLREAVGIRNNDLLSAVQELIECDLIERQVGHKRVEGEKSTASTYIVKWPNLVKPIKKKNTFEELFSEFLKSPETLLGTTVTNTNTVTDTVSVTDTNTESDTNVEVESDIEDETDIESVIDNEVETEKTFGVDCGVPQEEIEQFCKEPVPDEEDLSQYLRRVGRLT